MFAADRRAATTLAALIGSARPSTHSDHLAQPEAMNTMNATVGWLLPLDPLEPGDHDGRI